MSVRERFVIAASLEPCETGQEFASLPPHVTIVPPFTFDVSKVSELTTELADRAEEHGPMRFMVLSKIAYYGSGETVRELRGIGFGVHAACTSLVKALGGEFDDKYALLEWSPHVSKHDGLEGGQEVLLRALQLFGYTPEGKKYVCGNFNLLPRHRS